MLRSCFSFQSSHLPYPQCIQSPSGLLSVFASLHRLVLCSKCSFHMTFYVSTYVKLNHFLQTKPVPAISWWSLSLALISCSTNPVITILCHMLTIPKTVQQRDLRAGRWSLYLISQTQCLALPGHIVDVNIGT